MHALLRFIKNSTKSNLLSYKNWTRRRESSGSAWHERDGGGWREREWKKKKNLNERKERGEKVKEPLKHHLVSFLRSAKTPACDGMTCQFLVGSVWRSAGLPWWPAHPRSSPSSFFCLFTPILPPPHSDLHKPLLCADTNAHRLNASKSPRKCDVGLRLFFYDFVSVSFSDMPTLKMSPGRSPAFLPSQQIKKDSGRIQEVNL